MFSSTYHSTMMSLRAIDSCQPSGSAGCHTFWYHAPRRSVGCEESKAVPVSARQVLNCCAWLGLLSPLLCRRSLQLLSRPDDLILSALFLNPPDNLFSPAAIHLSRLSTTSVTIQKQSTTSATMGVRLPFHCQTHRSECCPSCPADRDVISKRGRQLSDCQLPRKRPSSGKK